jgi:hypothetical protein
VADVNMLGELLHGGEESLHGDSAYHSKELKEQKAAPQIGRNRISAARTANSALQARHAQSRRPFVTGKSELP